MKKLVHYVGCTILAFSQFAANAETVLWSDGFELADGRNWTTNAVWRTGSPTVGPTANAGGFRTHTGARCATTGLNGDASFNTNTRLICTNYGGQPYLPIPAASESPRLRYWQWFDFVNAYGYVEVQPQGSTNWFTLGQTNLSQGSTAETGGGVWSRPSLDLANFAGSNVLVAFHFGSGGNGFGSAPGWFVDDVALVTGAPVFNDPENFEAGGGDWSAESGTWEIGLPTSGPATNSFGWRAHSGTNCAGTVLGGNYGWNASTRLISPPFTVPSSNRPALRFAQWYQFVNAYGFVEVSSLLVLTNLSSTTNFLSATNINRNTNVISVTNIFFPSVYLQTNTAVFTNLNVLTNVFTVANPGSVAKQTNVLTFTNVNEGTDIFFVTNNLGPTYLQTNVWVFTNVNTFASSITNTASASTNNWRSVSVTNLSQSSTIVTSGGWTNTAVDLTAYAGQTLRMAFHFGSGGSGFGNAAGWYVDDLTLVTAPELTVPDSTNITVGQIFSAATSATNTSGPPPAAFRFALAAASTNAYITTNGIFNWTNARPAIGTNIFRITVAADGVPPVTTNNFTVIVSPPAFVFSASNTLAAKKYFLLSMQSLSNTVWRVDTSTNLSSATNWRPAFTSTVPVGGLLLFTDRLATNFPTRFYRITYP